MTYLIKYQTKQGIGTYKVNADSQSKALQMLAIVMKDARVKQYSIIQTVGYCAK